MVAAHAVRGRDLESAVGTGDSIHALVLMNIQLVMVGDAAVIFQSFGAAGLFRETGHGDIADLEQLRRGEENEIDRIVVDRVDDAALLDQDGLHAAFLQFDSTSESRGACADNQSVEVPGHNMLSTDL